MIRGFLQRKFKQAGISSTKARNAQKWLSEANAFERETGFRIAFALGLTVEETDEFFRTVLLDRSFDCHTIEEAIYYYCIYHGKGYPSAESLIAAAPQVGKTAVPSEGDVLYTKNIISYLRNCSSDEALLQYFRENLTQFGYNQVKAKEFIGQLWKQISEPNGLAELERKYFPQYEKWDNPAIENSTWGIYLQILGLSFDVERMIVPPAIIYIDLRNYAACEDVLMEGIEICDNYPELSAYRRKKHDLQRYLLDVYLEDNELDKARKMIFVLDEEYRLYGFPDTIQTEVRQYLKDSK